MVVCVGRGDRGVSVKFSYGGGCKGVWVNGCKGVEGVQGVRVYGYRV